MKETSVQQGTLRDALFSEVKTSRLEKLIAELCPDGVEYKLLENVLKIKNGKDYKEYNEGEVPVYGSGGIIAKIDTSVFDKPSILIPRKGSIDKLYYVDCPFWTVDTIFYTDIDTDQIIPKYLFYVLQKSHLEKLNTAGGVPSLTQAVLNKIAIPVPPIPVQEEIVRILDTFTELTAELTAELTKRKQQYQYYRDELLEIPDVPVISINAICNKVSSGKNKERTNDGLYPVYGSTGIISKTHTAIYNKKQILIARVGANAGFTHIAKGKYDVSDNTLIVDVSEKYNLKYVYYQLEKQNINTLAKGGGQPLVTATQIREPCKIIVIKSEYQSIS